MQNDYVQTAIIRNELLAQILIRRYVRIASAIHVGNDELADKLGEGSQRLLNWAKRLFKKYPQVSRFVTIRNARLAAQRADNAFHDALVEHYGAKKACDARYYFRMPTEKLRLLKQAKLDADAAVWAARDSY